jgi:hypothetical protein
VGESVAGANGYAVAAKNAIAVCDRFGKSLRIESQDSGRTNGNTGTVFLA